MNKKSKTIMAVLAIMMMLGVAFVPFTNTPTEGTDEAATPEKSVTFEDVLSVLKKSYNENNSADAGFSLILVNDTGTANKDVPTDITTTYTYGAGDVIQMSGSTPYVFGDGKSASNNGKIVIDNGAKLILCPYPDTDVDLGFTITDNNYHSSTENVDPRMDNVIVLKNGAVISICGMSFKVFCHADAEIPVVSFITGTSAQFISKRTGEQYEFGWKVLEGTGWKKMTVFDYFDNSDGTSWSFKGKREVTTTDNTFKVSFTDCNINILWKDGRFTAELIGTTVKSNFVIEATPNETGCDVNLSVDMKLDTITYSKGDEMEYKVIKSQMKFDNMKISTAFDSTTGTMTKGINWVNSGNIMIKADETHAYMAVGLVDIDFTFKNAVLNFNNPTMTLVEKYTITNAKPVKETVSMTSNTNITLGADEFSVNVPITFFDIKIEEVKKPVVTIDTLRTEYDASTEQFNTTAGSFGISGTVSTDTAVKVSNYNLALNIALTDFKLASKVDSNTLSFGANLDMSIRYNGSDKHFTIGIASLSTDGETLKIGSVAVKNDIPLSRVFGTEQDLIGYVNLSTLTVTESSDGYVIVGNGFSAECNTIVDGICDTVGLNSNGSFALAVALSETEPTVVFTLSGTSFTGYVKNIGGDKEAFSIEGSPAVIKITPAISNVAEIVSGTATFGAGLLPVTLVIDNGVTFKANGLSANAFDFRNGSKLSGTVTIDLADKLIYPYRTIDMDGQEIKMMLLNDRSGYVLTLDLQTKEGRIEAHNGWELTENSQYTLVDEMNATFTFGNKVFDAITTSEFFFSYEGRNPVKMNCGDTITLDELPEMTGMESVGWNDGTTTYAAGSTYTMPARTVNMTPVYAEVVKPTVVSPGVVEIKSTDSSGTAVAVKLQDLAEVEEATFDIGDSTVKMNKETIEAFGDDAETIVVTATAIEQVNDEAVGKTVGGNYLFDISLFVDGKKFTDFSEGMEFKVTLKVFSYFGVDGFNVSYVDDLGHSSPMTVDSVVECEDGSYDITFTTSHFSCFMVEPVYSDIPNGDSEISMIIVSVVALILILAFAVALYDYGTRKKKQ